MVHCEVNIMGTLKQLKQLYAQAEKKGDSEFVFEGKTLVTNFAKYLIEYLELQKLDKNQELVFSDQK